MPIEHIGIDIGSDRIRLARFASSFGSIEFLGYEEIEISVAPGRAQAPAEETAESTEAAGESAADEEATAEEAEPVGLEAEDEEEGPTVPPLTPHEIAAREKLIELAAQGRLSSQFTALPIASHRVTTRLLAFPFSAKKKIEGILRPELERVTPFETDNMLVDHVVLEPHGPGVRLLVYACEQTWIAHKLEAVEGGLDPRLLVPVAPALAMLPLDFGEASEAVAKEDSGKSERLSGLPRQLEAQSAAAVMFLGENEASLSVLRHGKPWVVHSLPFGANELIEDGKLSALGERFGRETSRVLRGFEANYGELPAQVVLLGAGAGNRALVEALVRRVELPLRPARLDTATIGEKAAQLLEDHPDAALAIALGLVSARKRYAPVPNFRREQFAFRSRWADVVEPLVPPATLAVVAVILFIVNSLLTFANLQSDVAFARGQRAQIYRQARGGEPPPEPVAALRRELEEKRQRLEIFRAISGISILNVLAEISSSIGNDVSVDFENFQLDNDRVMINGRLENYEAVDKIQEDLKASELFTEVDVRDTVPSPDNKIKFRLALKLATGIDDEDEGTDTGHTGTRRNEPSAEVPAPAGATTTETAAEVGDAGVEASEEEPGETTGAGAKGANQPADAGDDDAAPAGAEGKENAGESEVLTLEANETEQAPAPAATKPQREAPPERSAQPVEPKLPAPDTAADSESEEETAEGSATESAPEEDEVQRPVRSTPSQPPRQETAPTEEVPGSVPIERWDRRPRERNRDGSPLNFRPNRGGTR